MTNGYTTIKINDAVIGLRWGLPAIEWLREKTGEAPEVLINKGNTLSNSGYAYILYFGYKNECIYSELPMTLKMSTFMDLIEVAEDDPAIATMIADAIVIWSESRHVKKIIEETKGSEKKKEWQPDEIETYCYGCLGMSSKEYQACTWREFLLRYDGYQLRRSHEFEGHRLVAYKILWANIDTAKSSLPPMEEWWPLLTDEKQITEMQEKGNAEYAHLRALMDQAKNNTLYN